MATPEFIVYCDESGISAGPRCYSIGALVMPVSMAAAFEQWFTTTRSKHGLPVEEQKWKKLKASHGRINFLLEMFRGLLRHPDCRLHIMVVNTGLYRNWRTLSTEEAFYQTYTHLIQGVARHAGGTYQIVMDEKSDAYGKWTEAIQKIGNNMLSKRGGAGAICGVTKGDSKSALGLQAIDLVTGAVNAAHHMHLVDDLQIHKAKKLAIQEMAAILGWDGLHYDTFPTLGPKGPPNEVFNIWHFPSEYREVPASRSPPTRLAHPRRITPDDLANCG